MKILITNDDGFENNGIHLLAKWASSLGEVTVVAPKTEQSGTSHAIDFINPTEIRAIPFSDGIRAYYMDSTPADCVRFGILGLKEKYDLVLSGINKGVNVGGDIVYSGTVGAIFEAAKLGVPAIAFSSFVDGQEFAATQLDSIYTFICDNKLLEENPLYNINIPSEIKGMRITYQGSSYFSDGFKKIDDYTYIQVGGQIPDVCPDDINRDTVAIHNGYISLTPLTLSRTNMDVFRKHLNQ